MSREKISIAELYELYRKSGKISTDTRKDIRQSIYFAIKGENFDGNSFVDKALENGAEWCIVDDPSAVLNEKCLLVENSVETLQKLATFHRQKLKIPIIAITGSNGKTTTKELTAAVLGTQFKTFSTFGNLNNHIGVPLSLLSIDDSYEIAVLELGANHQGENLLLTQITLPDAGITTNIGKDHLGEFGGIGGVIKAYSEFTDYFNQNPEKLFFLNLDDPFLPVLIDGENCISFTLDKKRTDASITGKRVNTELFASVIVKTQSAEFEINTHFFGSFNLYNVLASAAIGLQFGISIGNIISAIEGYIPTNNRSHIIKYKTNTLIFDAYNANPSSMESAVSEFASISATKKCLILGDMYELGEYSFDEHQKMIDLVKKFRFEKVVLVGKEFSQFKPVSDFIFIKNWEELKNWFETSEFTSTTFFIKASRGEKLEKAFGKIYPANH